MSRMFAKNLIVGVSVVIVVLLATTILLGGYAIIKPADAETTAKVGCCPASGAGCPMMASSAANTQMMAMQAESTDCPKTPCKEDCPKPCCAGEKAEGACDNPCPVPCPKPCCAEDAPKGCCGEAEAAGCCAAKTTE